MSFWNDQMLLITGGAGFLGSYIVENFKIRKISENCKNLVKGVDVIIHLAGKVVGIGFNQRNHGKFFMRIL